MRAVRAHPGLIAVLALATLTATIAVEIVIAHNIDSRHEDRIESAKRAIAESVGERVLLLHGVADSIGVRDRADLKEFTRFANAQVRFDPAMLALQWLRPGELANPVLVSADGDRALSKADERREADEAIDGAESRNEVSTSSPVPLSGGGSGVYVAVPIEPGKNGGRLAKGESRSAVVGLVDTQGLTEDAMSGDAPGTKVADGDTELAETGGDQEDPVTASVDVHGRTWTITVDGGSRSSLERALPWLMLLAGLIFTAIVAVFLGRAIRRRDEALRVAQERAGELERRSREDDLTGLFNRRHFSERLTIELARGGEGVAVMLMDLDEFKRINDELGHLAGDRALQITAGRLADALRGSELLARWGGEEFALLVPRISRENAIAMAGRLRSALAIRPIELDGVSVKLTMSVGVATVADGLRTPDSLMGAADDAMYEAKAAGRNAVRVAEAGKPAPTGSRLP